VKQARLRSGLVPSGVHPLRKKLRALPSAHFRKNRRSPEARLKPAPAADFSFRLHTHPRPEAGFQTRNPYPRKGKEMTVTLYAQPYDMDATGFYFEDLKTYRANAANLKNS